MLIRSDNDDDPPFLLTMPLDSRLGAELERTAARLCLPPSGVMLLAFEHWLQNGAAELPSTLDGILKP